MYALAPNIDVGTMRETYVANMLCNRNLSMPQKGDLLVDDQYLFEVGGKTKSYKQIADIDNSYIITDGIDVGMGNRIPLWLFGMLY